MAQDHFYRDAPSLLAGRGRSDLGAGRGTVRCYRDLAALTTYLRSLGALGSSMESSAPNRCGDKSQWHLCVRGSPELSKNYF